MTTQEMEVAEILRNFNDKLDESENELKALKAGINSLTVEIDVVKKGDRERLGNPTQKVKKNRRNLINLEQSNNLTLNSYS